MSNKSLARVWPAFTLRRVRRAAIILGVVFGVAVASQTIGLLKTYPDAADRGQLIQSLGSSLGLQIMFGSNEHLTNSIASYATWRVLGILTIIGSVWALLTTTKLLRGEEEGGRWELLLAGPTGNRRATAQVLIGMLAALFIAFIIGGLGIWAAASDPAVGISLSGAIAYAFTMLLGASLFAAVGALTSQLAGTRQQAGLIGAVFLAACFMLRAAANTVHDLRWLQYINPLCWIDNVLPVTEQHFIWWLPVVALIAAIAGLALFLAGKRDLGASYIKEKDSGRAHRLLLKNQFLFGFRTSRPLMAGWLVGLTFMSALFGFLATTGANAIQSSNSLSQAVGKLTQQQMQVNSTKLFLGMVFFILAIVVMSMLSTAITAIRREEAESRLDNLLVRPVARWAWLSGRVVFVVLLAVLAAGVLSVVPWLTGLTHRSGVAYSDFLAAGVNVLGPGLLLAGLGIAVYGWRPRLTGAALFGIIGWGFLLEILGSVIKLNHWILDSSILHHMAAVPAVSPHWPTTIALISLGLAAAIVGVLGFAFRDLQTD